MLPAQVDPTAVSPKEIVAVVTAVGSGLLAAYSYYRRTGSISLSRLPLGALRRLFYTLRVVFATVPGHFEAFPLNITEEEAERYLGGQSYTLDWPFSFAYRGEDVNAARYYYDPEREYPHRQLHIRLRIRGGVVQGIDAHEEASALHHPLAHIRERTFTDATEWVNQRWSFRNPQGLDPRTFDGLDGQSRS